MDMVCQKAGDSPHDFTRDPIILVRDGDWLRAKDTSPFKVIQYIV
jgi:dipeptidase D